ncbi:SpoIID/LytB domain-containing protein [Neobacillus niacini]|uniref:SpoIID/LytB domain-containing protein n=1 Tax=Neobacillus niacini TaxID=86668 RepID=UPI00285E4BA7|nr:SpoIID/LytB domain-containing protein [Neobacillus niacini]MDR6999971.1 SpoIID/LytB domain protein [Neobacillus niacini]
MKKICSAFLVLLLLLSSLNFINVARAQEVKLLTVKLKNYIGNQKKLTITVKDEYDIPDTDVSLVEGKTYTVQVENRSLSLYENSTLISKFTSFTAVPKEYGPPNVISINNRPYLGTMNFTLENNTYVRPLNTLPLEDYLKGVVPFEMMASWNKEALKAQAVAARTYADRYKSLSGFDDTVSFQAYGGYSWNPNSTAAVEETISQTLTDNGRLIDAFYSASNGGMTESNASVWGGTPLGFYPIKQDPYDKKVPWSFTLNKTQIDTTSLDLTNPQTWWTSVKEIDSSLVTSMKNWMAQNGYADKEIKITSIPALSFSDKLTSGGRVRYGTIILKFYLKDKTTGAFVLDEQKQIKTNTLEFTDVKAARIRVMIGINVMKSYLVTSYKENSIAYAVSGLGNGHGVGMSQWGAKAMADQGLSYRDILSFYYPGTTLTNADFVPVVNTGTSNNTGAIAAVNENPAPTGSSDGNVPEQPPQTVGIPENTAKPPSIANVISSYNPKTKQITVNYTVFENVTTTVYVKNAAGKVLSYPVKTVKQKAGNQHAAFDVSKVPNGVYTFGIIVSNAQKASAISKVTVSKIVLTPKVGVVSNKDSSVSGTAEAKATIYVKAGSKVIRKGAADTKGKFKVTIPKQKAGTKLSISAKDTAGNTSKSFNLIVKDKIAPSKPKVNPVTHRDTVVTGTTEAKATITIKTRTKVLKYAKADSKGKFRAAISRQKAGTTLYVTSKDTSGNVSSATVVKVKTRR